MEEHVFRQKEEIRRIEYELVKSDEDRKHMLTQIEQLGS
jgi:hypothetical protein